ncbi:FeoA family protein [Vagococcus fluvialis]|uniref:FeoA family protein n=1 Tax=Vagococcus fluvialis TaxID=2738 RepID=UPI003B58EA75
MESIIKCQLNRIYQFQGFDGSKVHERHLNNLGLVAGVDIYIVSKQVGQPIIVVFQGTRIGLDETIAKGIKVTEKESTQATYQTSLDELKEGDTAKVVQILGTGALKRRLMDMGLTKKTQIKIKKFAPLGDPIEIEVRNYELTLRKNEANLILVEREQTT